MVDAASEFVAAARGFREAVADGDVEAGEFARRVRNALARVYLAAALLGPPTAVDRDDAPPDLPRARDTSRALRGRLASRFGERDVFVENFDPTGIDGEDMNPFPRSLSSELVEIDEDLAVAIARLERDAPNAHWDVRFGFEQHWGRHAVACLRPLHQLATYGIG